MSRSIPPSRLFIIALCVAIRKAASTVQCGDAQFDGKAVVQSNALSPYVPVLAISKSSVPIYLIIYIWTAVAGATKYHVQVYRGTTLILSKVNLSAVCMPGTCSFRHNIALIIFMLKSWQIRHPRQPLMSRPQLFTNMDIYRIMLKTWSIQHQTDGSCGASMLVTTNYPIPHPSPETSLAEFDTLPVSTLPGRILEEERYRYPDTQKPPRQLFEPVSDHPYNLSYACLLIPRFVSHNLVGDVVQYLYDWMQQINISFGWQLEYVDVQPEHMQWILNVPAAISPAHFIRVTREHTSNSIFEEFPRFKKQNLGKDFWAPGHLVIVGKQPHSPEMIKEFIRLTRQQQGFLSFSRSW